MPTYTTKVELNKQGVKERVYHANQNGSVAWTHPYSEKKTCEVCNA